MVSENSSVNEHIGHAAMQSMETLRQAGFSEGQSKAQVESMLFMYDDLKSEINGLRLEINDLKLKFNALESEVKVLSSRVHRSEIITVLGFVGVIITIAMAV